MSLLKGINVGKPAEESRYTGRRHKGKNNKLKNIPNKTKADEIETADFDDEFDEFDDLAAMDLEILENEARNASNKQSSNYTKYPSTGRIGEGIDKNQLG